MSPATPELVLATLGLVALTTHLSGSPSANTSPGN